MALGLVLYGTLVGLICSAFSYFSGHISLMSAIGLYSAIGATAVILGAVLLATRRGTVDDIKVSELDSVVANTR